MNTNMAIDTNELLKKITVVVHITGVKRMQLRLWVASRIIALGALIGGLGFKIEEIKEMMAAGSGACKRKKG